MTAMTQLLEMRLMGMTAQSIDIEGLYIFRLRGAMGPSSESPFTKNQFIGLALLPSK